MFGVQGYMGTIPDPFNNPLPHLIGLGCRVGLVTVLNRGCGFPRGGGGPLGCSGIIPKP